MGVSENSGTPKSFILIGFSIIFAIQFGVLLFLETPIWRLGTSSPSPQNGEKDFQEPGGLEVRDICVSFFFDLKSLQMILRNPTPPPSVELKGFWKYLWKNPTPTFSAVKLGWCFVWFPPPYGFYSILVQQNWRSNTMKPGRPSPRLGSPETFEAKLEQAQNDLGIPSVEQIPIQSLGTSWTVFFLNFGWVEEFRWWERWRYRHDFGPCQPESCFQKGVSQTTKLETFQVNFQGIFFPLLFGTVDCRLV